MNKIEADIGIIGAGVTGLMLTKKLSEVGLSVVLIDKNQQLATGPSTRNEGWLHRGTYHATSIKDRSNAIQVAKRCIYGHEQIRRFAPEAVEDPESHSYAVVRNSERVTEIQSRWNEAEVLYKPISLSRFEREVPEAVIQPTDTVFQVQDVGINTRLLYQKLLCAGVRAGASVYPNTEVSFRDTKANIARLTPDAGEHLTLAADLFIHTSGNGMKEFFEKNFDITLPTRFWKSHLLVTPRLSKHNVFAVDPYEAGMMNHGQFSIVGANEDALLVNEPNYEIDENGVKQVENAIRRLYKVDGDVDGYPVACIKVDMPLQTAAARSLNISVSEPIPDHLCILPGKMTEAAFVTDTVTRIVFDRQSLNGGHNAIALRPCDMQAQAVLA
ncbi:MAG TPA: FAD-dependent oxidoreductase [Candidatus Saccharimonadales bacterium]|nr:FAD-dependent oxidoreductase [Candidatus Saccharimonadales bacterium]